MFWGFTSIRAAEGTLGRRNIHKLVKPSFGGHSMDKDTYTHTYTQPYTTQLCENMLICFLQSVTIGKITSSFWTKNHPRGLGFLASKSNWCI